jgi:hypothetical protein
MLLSRVLTPKQINRVLEIVGLRLSDISALLHDSVTGKLLMDVSVGLEGMCE